MKGNKFSKFCLNLFVRIFCLQICCLLTSVFCISTSGSQFARMLLQVASIIVLVAFIYPVCHTKGDLDAPLINAGKKKFTPLMGLYAGLISNSVFMISSIVLLISKLFGVVPNFFNYYKMINSIYFPYLYSIMPVDYTINEISFVNISFAILVQIVIPVICMIAYILGVKRFSFSEKILYKSIKKTS